MIVCALCDATSNVVQEVHAVLIIIIIIIIIVIIIIVIIIIIIIINRLFGQ